MEVEIDENASVSGDGMSSMNDSIQSERDVLGQIPDIANNYRTPGPVTKFCRRRWNNRPQKGVLFVLNRIYGVLVHNVDYLSEVQPHILRKIFFYLNKRDLMSAMGTCRLFHRIGLDRRFWSFLNVSGKHLSESVMHWLFDRQIKVLNASSTMIYHSDFFTWYDFCKEVIPPAMLTHLDLSMARFSSTSVLRLLLSRCSHLKALSLEQCDRIDDSICDEIAENEHLQILNLIMAKEVTVDGLHNILQGCPEIRELNIGWIDWNEDIVGMLTEYLPPKLKRLNISGICDAHDLDDEMLQKICERCPVLEDLDVSDCAGVTTDSIEILNAMPKLSSLSLSRCYGIDPTAFMQLRNLRSLNIFGCVTDEGADFLRSRLRPTCINITPFSGIARPTFGDSVTSIWRCRTRDWY